MQELSLPQQEAQFEASQNWMHLEEFHDQPLRERPPQPESGGWRAGLRRAIGRTAAVAALAAGTWAGVIVIEGSPSAHADQMQYDPATGGYPDIDALPTAATRANPAVSDYIKNGSVHSPRGYDYRNCTDYVAWRVATEGLADTDALRGLGNANTWDDRAPVHGWQVQGNAQLPEVGDVAQRDGGYGHVAFVEAAHEDDNTIDIAQYNQTLQGTFTRQLHVPVSAFNHYIDLNGPNPPGFVLQLFADGTRPPVPAQPTETAQSSPPPPPTAEAPPPPPTPQEQFDNVPDGAIIRSISGSWYEKMGDTLQWITEDNQLAIQLGLTDRRYGADNRYNDVFVTQFEESKRYSWEARLRDARSGAIPLNEHPVDRGFTLDQIRSAARSLGFDDVRLDKPDMSRGSFIPSAKSIRLVKNGEGYGANMDLIARIITGDNVFAYPSAWGDYRSWNAYLMPS